MRARAEKRGCASGLSILPHLSSRVAGVRQGLAGLHLHGIEPGSTATTIHGGQTNSVPLFFSCCAPVLARFLARVRRTRALRAPPLGVVFRSLFPPILCFCEGRLSARASNGAGFRLLVCLESSCSLATRGKFRGVQQLCRIAQRYSSSSWGARYPARFSWSALSSSAFGTSFPSRTFSIKSLYPFDPGKSEPCSVGIRTILQMSSLVR